MLANDLGVTPLLLASTERGSAVTKATAGGGSDPNAAARLRAVAIMAAARAGRARDRLLRSSPRCARQRERIGPRSDGADVGGSRIDVRRWSGFPGRRRRRAGAFSRASAQDLILTSVRRATTQVRTSAFQERRHRRRDGRWIHRALVRRPAGRCRVRQASSSGRCRCERRRSDRDDPLVVAAYSDHLDVGTYLLDTVRTRMRPEQVTPRFTQPC